MIYADAGVNGSRFESNQLYHITHLKINSVFNSALLKDTLKAYFWYSNTFLRLWVDYFIYYKITPPLFF